MTAPAAMPSEEDVARAIYLAFYNGKPNLAFEDQEGLWRSMAAAAGALFAPILAEKQKPTVALNHWKARALAAEAALAAERERCAKIAEGPEYWPHPPEPGDRLTYRGTDDHNWLAVKPPYRINSYSQGRADAAAAIRAQGE